MPEFSNIIYLLFLVCCVVTLCMRRKKQISAFQYRILTDSTTSATGVRRNNATTQANSSNPQTTGAATRESAIPLPYYPPYDYSPSSVAPSKTADNSTLVKGIITGTSINARPRPVVIRREEMSRLRPGDLVSLGIEISPDGKSRQVVIFNLLIIYYPKHLKITSLSDYDVIFLLFSCDKNLQIYVTYL